MIVKLPSGKIDLRPERTRSWPGAQCNNGAAVVISGRTEQIKLSRR